MNFFIILSMVVFLVGVRLLRVPGRAVASIVFLLAVILAVLCGFYLVSSLFTSGGIDESVLYHLKFGIEGAGFREYAGTLLFSVFLLIVSLLYGFSCFYLALVSNKNKYFSAGGMLLLPIAFSFNPAVIDLATIGKQYFSEGEGVLLPDFYQSNKVSTLREEFEKPNNLVLIYSESLERTYFDNNLFPGLVGNLSRLEKNAISFSNIVQLPGMGWTIGGMVASQCGVPLVASSGGNSMEGVDQFLPGAYCIGDVLSEKGYVLDYIGGADSSFAGKHSFYKTHGFDSVKGLSELILKAPDPDYKNAWGLYDDTTLSFVKERFDTLAGDDKPFALVSLTLDTHHPEGHLSHSCKERLYRDGSNPVLNSVNCSDRLISGLVKHIQASEYAEDTTIVIMSDHLAMQNTASETLQRGVRRNLFMALGDEITPATIDRVGSTMDLAPTILHLMGFDVDALGLGRNLLGDSPNFMEENQAAADKIRELYPSIRKLWLFPSLRHGLYINTSSNAFQIGGRMFRYPALIKLDEGYGLEDVLLAGDTHKYLSSIEEYGPFLLIGQCSDFSYLKQVDSPKAACLLSAKDAESSGHVEVIKEEKVYFSFREIESLFDENANGEGQGSLVRRLAKHVAGGELYLDGEWVSSISSGLVLSDIEDGRVLEALPNQDKKFVKWSGLSDERKYQRVTRLEAGDAPVALTPIFDVSVSANSNSPEFRSAWAGIAIKGEGVLDQHLSPSSNMKRVARLARRLKSGVEVDIRSMGGLGELGLNHFILVNGSNVAPPGRGIKLVVINPDGGIHFSKTYDTFASENASDELEKVIASSEQGQILLFATQDDFTRALTPGLLESLRDLGFDLE